MSHGHDHRQELGFTPDEIADLLALRVDDHAACEAVESATREKLSAVELRIRELERLRVILRGLIGSCHARRPTPDCPVLALLEEPTMFEAIRMVAQAFARDMSRLSCCAA